MNSDRSFDDYNMFIRECVRQLKKDRYCYCYNLEQANDIQKRCKEKLHIQNNDCGYTLSYLKKKGEIKYE